MLAVQDHRAIYDREFEQYKKYELENWRISYLKRVFDFLAVPPQNVTSEDRFLDVGVGGSGYTTIEAARRGLESVGVDISAKGMSKAQSFAKEALAACQHDMCHFVVCAADYLPFKGAVFSKVCSIAVLEHIPADTQAIAEMSRVVMLNGRVFITVPNAYRRMLPVFWLPYLIHDRKVGHLRHYKAETIVERFVKRGFALYDLVYHVHLTKIVQYLLSKIFPQLRKPNSRIWWKLENLDFAVRKLPTGLHFSASMIKLSIQHIPNMISKR